MRSGRYIDDTQRILRGGAALSGVGDINCGAFGLPDGLLASSLPFWQSWAKRPSQPLAGARESSCPSM